MSTEMTVLACGSMRFTTADYIVIYGVVSLWTISFLIALPNLCLAAFVKRSLSFKVTHGALFLSYRVPMIALVSGLISSFNGSVGILLFAAFGLPIAALFHFVHLLLTYRKLRPKRERKIEQQSDDYQGPRCVACNAPIQLAVRLCPSCGWTQPASDRA